MKFKELINTLYDMKVPQDFDIIVESHGYCGLCGTEKIEIDRDKKYVTLVLGGDK